MSLSNTIISFDPGETTGISILENGIPIINMTVVSRAFVIEEFLLALVKIAQPSTIVIEKLPSRGYKNKDQDFVYHRIIHWFKTAGISVVLINPGRWKHLVERSKLTSTHMRDAADLGKWYYRTHVLLEKDKVR